MFRRGRRRGYGCVYEANGKVIDGTRTGKYFAVVLSKTDRPERAHLVNLQSALGSTSLSTVSLFLPTFTNVFMYHLIYIYPQLKIEYHYPLIQNQYTRQTDSDT
jgi:hypothetical protein